MIGREDNWSFQRDHLEQIRWIGKPWRRIELLVNRHYWRGDQAEVNRDLTFHLGSRRLGVYVQFAIGRIPGLDYSEDRP